MHYLMISYFIIITSLSIVYYQRVKQHIYLNFFTLFLPLKLLSIFSFTAVAVMADYTVFSTSNIISAKGLSYELSNMTVSGGFNSSLTAAFPLSYIVASGVPAGVIQQIRYMPFIPYICFLKWSNQTFTISIYFLFFKQ